MTARRDLFHRRWRRDRRHDRARTTLRCGRPDAMRRLRGRFAAIIVQMPKAFGCDLCQAGNAQRGVCSRWRCFPQSIAPAWRGARLRHGRPCRRAKLPM